MKHQHFALKDRTILTDWGVQQTQAEHLWHELTHIILRKAFQLTLEEGIIL